MQPRKQQFKEQYGPWVCIAGASVGLGAEFARALAQRGLNLVLVARREKILTDFAKYLVKNHPVQVRTLALDLAGQETAMRIAEETKDLEVGLLVYNAAASMVGAFHDHPLGDHLSEVDTNVRAPLQLVDLFSRRMLQAGRGGIILMSSLSAFQGSAYISTYSATKAFNIVLAEGLWEEWRRQGVDVLACVAGAVLTPNFLASAPRKTGGISDAALEPETVVEAALAELGKRPIVIPGRMNQVSSFVMRHLLPRTLSVRVMGAVLRKKYAKVEATDVDPTDQVLAGATEVVTTDQVMEGATDP